MVNSETALLIVDLQNDFCPGGALAVPEGDEIVPAVNRRIREHSLVAATKDWHPKNHVSFASNHPGRIPFETLETGFGTQMLWPDHCIMGTPGALLHPGLDLSAVSVILQKGMREQLDSYSAFFENDRRTPTGLHGFFQDHGVTHLEICGLALDVCVYHTAMDARRLGYTVTLLTEASRGVDLPAGSMQQRISEMEQQGVRIL